MKFSIHAKENSTTNGAGKSIGTFRRGDLVIITCNPEETWSLGSGSELTCNANGLDGKDRRNPNWSINGGTMVGSIDNGKSFFPVGTLCQIPVTADGTNILLYCLDINKDDNSGAISAFVQTF